MNLASHLGIARRMDWLTATAMFVIACVGVLFIYSASYVAGNAPVVDYKRQIVWILMGSGCFFVLAATDYHQIVRHAHWIHAAAIGLLLLTLFAGSSVREGKRWLSLGFIAFQPAEFAKLASIIMLTQVMSRPKMALGSLRSIGMIIGTVALPFLLILAQPDFGTAAVLIPLTFVLMFTGGVPLRTLIGFLLIGAVVGSLVLGMLFLPERLGASEETQERCVKMTLLRPYHKSRIVGFLWPEKDPRRAGWSKLQSEIAIGSGGMTGKGYKKGTSNLLGFLPRTVAPTDFIFSVIAEEAGFLGASTVLLLFMLIIAGALRAAVQALDDAGRLLCVGVAVLLFMHVFVNTAMAMGLVPVTGLPLPLMSSGGTFVITVMSALGIVQSVFARRYVSRY